MRPVRIVLVEDNEVFRDALELLLGMRADVEVVASVGDGAAAVAAAIEHRPGRRADGLPAARPRRHPGDGAGRARRCPDVAVVALTASADAAEREALVEAGAVACLTKDQELDEIVAAILHAPPQRREAHRREHGDRPRLDRRPAGRRRPLPELARRAALRPLRRREPARRRRHRRGRVLRAAA